MVSGATPPRESAARAATAPRSMAETGARAPPDSPSPRLPPIHSAMGVRAPETITTSGSPLLDTGLLLRIEEMVERGCRSASTLDAVRHGTSLGGDASRAGKHPQGGCAGSRRACRVHAIDPI